MAVKYREIELLNLTLNITKDELSNTRFIMKYVLKQSNRNAIAIGKRLHILETRRSIQSTQAQTQKVTQLRGR